MQMKTIGRTGISVSAICLGTMTWGTQNSEAEAHEQMDHAFAEGINFFDTAELYPVTPLSAETQGLTEDYIATWFQKIGRRQDVVLATKVSGPGRPYIRGGRSVDAAGMKEALEASLKRLRTDYIDLYQIHWPNRGHFHFRQNWGYDPYKQDRQQAAHDLQEILETMDGFVKAGKVRAFGLSNETSWGTMKYLDLAERHGLPRVSTIQNEYNLLYRHYDLDMAEMSHHEDIGLLAYSPLAGGILSGKYLDGSVPKGSRADVANLGGRLVPSQEPATRAYVELARAHGLDPAAMALAFCMTRPFMLAPIIGATSMGQLKTAISARDITLSKEVLNGIEKIHRQYPLPF
jgi:aryl-alcohol dehydrogenase-like predicted oxidoreductase